MHYSLPGSSVHGILQARVLEWVTIESESEVIQSCLTLCDPMDCSLPGSTVHGIFQAILEWVAIFFSRRSSWHRDWTRVSHIVGRRFTIWSTREVQPGLPLRDHNCQPRIISGRRANKDIFRQTKQNLPPARNSLQEILKDIHLTGKWPYVKCQMRKERIAKETINVWLNLTLTV